MGCSEEIEELKGLLVKALDMLYKNDFSLIERRVNERSITFRFGVYLEELVKLSNYNGLNVDAEYNKNGTGTKSTSSRPNGAYPDIILHERGSNNKNKLVVEFKGYWNRDKCAECDKRKLRDFTSKKQEYKYILGAFVFLKLNKPRVDFFIDGKSISPVQSVQKELNL